MATMIIPSKAYGARAKRSVAGPGLWARFLGALKASYVRAAALDGGSMWWTCSSPVNRVRLSAAFCACNNVDAIC